jgi:hypothetical protein
MTKPEPISDQVRYEICREVRGSTSAKIGTNAWIYVWLETPDTDLNRDGVCGTLRELLNEEA